jgi:hypothetical protein
MRVFDIDWKAMEDEVERLKTEGPRGGGDRNYWKPKDGDNYIRILPPYNSRGRIFKRRIQHFNLPPEDSICSCLLSWPQTYDRCPVCDVIDKITKKFSGVVDMGRQNAVDQYAYNIIDRDNEKRGVQIYTTTPAIHQWIQNQMNDKKIGNITDVTDGFDVKIVKGKKKGGSNRGSNVKYDKYLMPRPCPLHNSDKVIDDWLSAIYDLDEIFKPVDEDVAASIREIATGVWHYYSEKYGSSRRGYGRDDDRDDDRHDRKDRDDYDDHDQDRDIGRDRDDDRRDSRDRDRRDESRQSRYEARKDDRDRSSRQDRQDRDDDRVRDRSDRRDQDRDRGRDRDRDRDGEDRGRDRGRNDIDGDDEPFANYNDDGSRKDEPRREEKSRNADKNDDRGGGSSRARDFLDKHRKVEERDGVMVPQDAKPSQRGVPVCFAGLDKPEPHEDGTIGFSTKVRKCTFCPNEGKCQIEARKRGTSK